MTTPVAATLRYAGPLGDYGNVMLLEPEDGYLLVFAGLETLYSATGDVLPMSAPLGHMGGLDETTAAGAALPETLYIELRQDNKPIDPTAWFDLDKDKS